MDPVFADLAGKSALVTGSTRGIGAGLADALERAGMQVIRHGLHDDTTAAGKAVAADLSHVDGVAALAEAVATRVDRLDVLVNNAGVELPARMEHLEERDVRITLDVNLTAPMLLVRELLPLLSGDQASVVNVTSIHDDVPYSGNVGYVASKAGLEAATRTMALELAPHGIRVNSIAPGAIDTDMNRDVTDGMGREMFSSWIPLGRIGTVDDLVAPMLFLASNASRYMTGARLLVDGGYSLALLRYGL
jgi:glucose 1-dehydrogenase